MVLRSNWYMILIVRRRLITVATWSFDYTPASGLNLDRNVLTILFLTTHSDPAFNKLSMGSQYSFAWPSSCKPDTSWWPPPSPQTTPLTSQQTLPPCAQMVVSSAKTRAWECSILSASPSCTRVLPSKTDVIPLRLDFILL